MTSGNSTGRVTGGDVLSLRSHPRLFVGPERIANLGKPITLEWLKGVDSWVRENADKWLELPPFTDLDKTEFGYCTYIGREHEMRVTALAIRWMQSGEDRYRQGVLDYIRWMKACDPWSEEFDGGPVIPANTSVNLNHGERALTLALAYDWLFDSLSVEEKALFLDVATTYIFAPAILQCRKGGAWWFDGAHNNWNGVCAGGLGILCLAMYDESAEARELLPRVEHSLGLFVRAHADNSGASEEGTGYWNYGMRYAALYLRSHEEAIGTRHPLLALPFMPASLAFPFDFSPRGMDVGFGDIPGFGQPLPFHYDTARALGCTEVMRLINARVRQNPYPVPSTNTGTGLNYWNALEGATPLWLLVHDGVDTPAPRMEEHVVRVITGLDWGILADRMPQPDLYMSVRGGNAGAAHAHDDLLSFNCCVGNEILIGNPKPCKYLPTTFTKRRGEIPDINPQFKNTILINGVGIYHGTKTDSVEVVEGPGCKGIRMVATTAFTTPAGSPRPRNMSRLDFVGRLFLMLDWKAWLIVDCISSPKGGPSLCESRLHTYAKVDLAGQGASLTGKNESLRLAFASNMPGTFLATATTAPTTASDKPATMLRWCMEEHVREIAPRVTIMATLLTPGTGMAAVSILQDGQVFELTTSVAGVTNRLRLRENLKFAAAGL
jgi:hypothetical protein